MDLRVADMLAKEQQRRNLNKAKKMKYRTILRKTLASLESKPEHHLVVYQNNTIMETLLNELEQQMNQMEKKGMQLQNMVNKTQNRIDKEDTFRIQREVEIIDQHIRILEAGLKHL